METFGTQAPEESNVREITTLRFFDMKSNSEAVLIIRSSEKEIALCLSLLNAGDIDVRLSPENVRQVIRGLEKAVESVNSKA